MSKYFEARERIRVSEVMEDSDSGSDDDIDYSKYRGMSAADALGSDDSASESGGSDDDGGSVDVEAEEQANLAKFSSGDVIAGKVFCSVCPRKFFVKAEDYTAHVGSKVNGKRVVLRRSARNCAGYWRVCVIPLCLCHITGSFTRKIEGVEGTGGRIGEVFTVARWDCAPRQLVVWRLTLMRCADRAKCKAFQQAWF